MISEELKVARAVLKSSILRLSPLETFGALRSWQRYGNSFATLAAIAAQRFPKSYAIFDDDGRLTYAELMARSSELARQLQKQQALKAGQIGALICKNHRSFVINLLALSCVGADILLLRADSPGKVLGKLLAGQPVHFVLHDEEFARLLDDSIRLESQPINASHSVLTKIKSQHKVPERRTPHHRGGQLVLLTSGSSGVCKTIRRSPTLTTMVPVLASLVDVLPIKMNISSILAIPLDHGYGLATLAMSIAMGGQLYMSKKFDIASLLSRLPQEEEAIVVSVPTLLKRWLKQEHRSQSRHISAVITGSAPLESFLCTQLLQLFGPVLFNFYGSTEAGIISVASPSLLREAPGSVGTPFPGHSVRLLDETGNPVPSGSIGRICVSSPLVLKPDEHGNFQTGDLGYLDECGRLFIIGRTDNMFVSGGENVYPEETEEMLTNHPAVLDAAVTVIPDEEFGQRMLAWVVPKPGQLFDETAVHTWLRERLERHKLPRRICVISEIPRNALGKIDRKALPNSQS